MRLIDADALIGELHTTYLYDDNARAVIYRKIEKQPTVGGDIHFYKIQPNFCPQCGRAFTVSAADINTTDYYYYDKDLNPKLWEK